MILDQNQAAVIWRLDWNKACFPDDSFMLGKLVLAVYWRSPFLTMWTIYRTSYMSSWPWRGSWFLLERVIPKTGQKPQSFLLILPCKSCSIISITSWVFWGGTGLYHAACSILVPWPGSEPALTAMKEWSFNHWTTREVPTVSYHTEIQSAFYVCPGTFHVVLKCIIAL